MPFNPQQINPIDLNPNVAVGVNLPLNGPSVFTPNYLTSQGGALMTNFEFNVSKTSNTTSDDSTALVIDTILLSYKNPLANGRPGSISFDVTYGV